MTDDEFNALKVHLKGLKGVREIFGAECYTWDRDVLETYIMYYNILPELCIPPTLLGTTAALAVLKAIKSGKPLR